MLLPRGAQREQVKCGNLSAVKESEVFFGGRGRACDNGYYSAKIYKNKKALLSSSDFKDDDIYGTALSAVTKEHYGEEQIFFRGYDGGYANLVDWDFLALYALEDGSFMCIKILDDLEE